MSNRIKIKGTSERSFDIGLTNKQTFDANHFTASHTWVLPNGDGSDGYSLTTNGLGVLSWAPSGAASDNTTPYFIPAGETFTNHINRQNLFHVDIVIDGVLAIDGMLIEV